MNPKNMNFSAFERYVRIVETVRNSDCHLSMGDRMELIEELLDNGLLCDIAFIENACAQKESDCLEGNMIAARLSREYQRGY